MQGLPERAPRRRSAQSRRPLSEEHKAKIRAAHAGRKRQPLDEEHKRCKWLVLRPAPCLHDILP